MNFKQVTVCILLLILFLPRMTFPQMAFRWEENAYPLNDKQLEGWWQNIGCPEKGLFFSLSEKGFFFVTRNSQQEKEAVFVWHTYKNVLRLITPYGKVYYSYQILQNKLILNKQTEYLKVDPPRQIPPPPSQDSDMEQEEEDPADEQESSDREDGQED